jgi:hypothetical protein
VNGLLKNARVKNKTQNDQYLAKYLHICVLTSGAMTENFGQKEGGKAEPEVRDLAERSIASIYR